MAKLPIKPTVFRSVPWILFAVVLIPAFFTTAVGILVLVLGDAPGSIALGILTICFAVGGVTGGFLALGLILRQNKLTRMQTEFIANVSHELRTPMASIRMYVETLRMGRVRTEHDREECLEALDRESARLSRLVEQLLGFRRSASGRGGRALRDVVRVGELVEAVVKPLQLRADIGDRLSMVVEPALPPLEVSREGFHEALSNLVQNALSHGGPDGPIVVTARAEREGIAISVRDSGPGIDPDDVKKIFGRFFRAQSTTEGSVAGFGLGLSIVDRFSRDHGGEVLVDSAPGKGAIFTMWLPASDRPRTHAAGEGASISPLHRSA